MILTDKNIKLTFFLTVYNGYNYSYLNVINKKSLPVFNILYILYNINY